MTRVIIADELGQHGIDIKTAILEGYGSDISDQIEINNWTDAYIRMKTDSNIIAVIRSMMWNIEHIKVYEAIYPRVQGFYPLGSNSFIQLTDLISVPIMVTCGAGDTNYENRNNTGYGLGLEFWDNDLLQSAGSDASSFANGIILGKMLKIKDTLSCSWWEARYRARMTADRNETNRETSPWDLRNGYGIINTGAAIEFTGVIPDDPYIPPSLPEEVQLIKGVLKEMETPYGVASFCRVKKVQLTGSSATIEWDTFLNESSYTSNRNPMMSNTYKLTADRELRNKIYDLLLEVGKPFEKGTIVYES